MQKDKITGIILAGGKSSRMGKDKGLCEYKGRALVTYAIEVLKPLCGRIIICANNQEEYNVFGFEVFPDEIKGIGPMGGILSGLKQSETEHNLVLSCDTPFVTGDLFQRLIQHIEKNQIVVPFHQDGKLEPLAAYYATNVIAELAQCVESGDYKMMNFLQKVRTGTFDVDSLWPGEAIQLFHNLNTPDDLLKC